MDVSQRGLPHRYRSGELYAGVYASLNWWYNYLTAPGFSRYDRWVAQYYSECQYKGSYGIWQYISTWSIGGKDFDGNWAYKDYPSIVKAMTGEKTPEKEEDDMTAEEVKKIALEAIQTGEQSGGARRDALELQLEQLNQKREAALDAFLSRDITKEELRRMTTRYDREAAELRQRLARARTRSETSYAKATLREDIRRRAAALVGGEGDSEVFYKNILDHMVVHRDRRVEVRLNLLPQTWSFVLERLNQTVQNDPDVPMSVSRPFSSG